MRVKFQRLSGIAGAALLVTGCAHSAAGRAADLPTATAEAAGPVTGQSETRSQVVLDRELVEDFRERVADYMKLHERLQTQGTRQKQRDDVGENLVSENALAMRIRFERHDARPGDVFTPPIALALRRAMDPELRGLAALQARESIRDDASEIFVLVVNGDYAAGASRSTMPGNVLQILPPLPRGLEYRIVDTHLILLDINANIVVDYVLDVMCKTC